MRLLLFIVAVMLILTGCVGAPRAHGGSIIAKTTTGATLAVKQPENPQDASKQAIDVDDTADMFIPPGSVLTVPEIITDPVTHVVQTNRTEIKVEGTNVAQVHRTHHEHSAATVGASQPDVVGETIAKLKSSKWITVVGIFVFFVGVGIAAYPPARLIMGGMTPGAALAGAGLVIAALPYILIGNERFFGIAIFATVGVALLAWYIHHHGGLAAELNHLKSIKPAVPSQQTVASPASPNSLL